MIEFIYQTLATFGYTHPLHPILAHVPIGLVIGAFIFALAAMIFKWIRLVQSDRHCIVLALLLLVPGDEGITSTFEIPCSTFCGSKKIQA